ncbi:MAG: sulfiredoxin [Leptolyngbyaceae cyanobacterium bins.59]|nr:sulfiredoxin [Leptolyngbyaceae cyanobacterium bins.59]
MHEMELRSMARIEDVPMHLIRRPLFRQNDQAKVAALMESIQQEGLREPIDVLEVEGQYYGFSGCHRFEACTRLGHETIRCRVRRAPKSVLRMHLA